MQPPNDQNDKDDATIIRPAEEASEITQMQHAIDADATQIKISANDATIIKTQPGNKEQTHTEIDKFGPLDTARLQKSPIPAHFKTNQSKLGLRAATIVIFLIAWISALWWYKTHHHPELKIAPPPAIEIPINPAVTEHSQPNTPPPTPIKQPEPISQTPAIEKLVPAQIPFKILSKNIDELQTLAEAAIKQNRLEPATDSTSATGLLIQMNLINSTDERTIGIRSLLAEAHLKLSKRARSKNDSDAAEHHTEEAWNVRKNDTYLSIP